MLPIAARTRRVLVAPDSFKGTFRAPAVAAAIAAGLQRAGFIADQCPVADGGEGTIDAVLAASEGEVREARVRDPLGREIIAGFAMVDDGRTAIIESAAASGLELLAPHELDPWRASTYGTGELIGAAKSAGAQTILVTVGGSATVDGGAGALKALDERAIDFGQTRLVVLCDVHTPWELSAETYGPQKGADPRLVCKLAHRLDELAWTLPRDPRGVPGTGAAGGLSGGLWARHGAELAPGGAYVLDSVGFNRRLARVIAVVCGEGRIDAQSRYGKVIGEIAARAHIAQVPVHAIVGRNELDPASQHTLGIQSVSEATTLAEMEHQAVLLGRRLIRRSGSTTS